MATDFETVHRRLAGRVLGGTEAPFTCALKVWGAEEDPDTDDGVACRGWRFMGGKARKEDEDGEVREARVRWQIGKEGANGLSTQPEEHGFVWWNGEVYLIVQSDDAGAWWDVVGVREVRTEVHGDGFYGS